MWFHWKILPNILKIKIKFTQFLPENGAGGTLSKLFYEVRITMVSKLDNDMDDETKKGGGGEIQTKYCS